VKNYILTINPGSTSTKIVFFEGSTPVFSREEQHEKKNLVEYPDVWSQFAFRMATVSRILDEARRSLDENELHFNAVVGRGGLLAPLPGGVYGVNRRMLEDLRLQNFGEHPCNLGAPLAQEIADRFGSKAYIVDPVVTDELCPEARLTGLPQIQRRSIFHALSQRGAARQTARKNKIVYEHGKFIVAHLGGGISIGAHLRGRVVDVTNALDGEGPMTPERTGTLPVLEVLRLLEDGVYTIQGLRRAVLGQGGFLAHLGTNDFHEVERLLQQGDDQAGKVFHAFASSVAKHAASLLPTLVTRNDPSPIDALVITGGLARSKLLISELSNRLSFIGPLEIVLGMTEAQIMAESVLAVLQKKAPVLEYTGAKHSSSLAGCRQ
jgi:butyrate kinase